MTRSNWLIRRMADLCLPYCRCDITNSNVLSVCELAVSSGLCVIDIKCNPNFDLRFAYIWSSDMFASSDVLTVL